MSKYIVRYGMMRSIGVMTVRHEDSYRRGDEVIVRSDRGVEVGQVLCEATEDALSSLDGPPSGTIMRLVSDDDASVANDIDGLRKQRIETCKRHIKAKGLEMKLIDVESLFGGERIVVYYLAEDRVDFRELVKVLAGEFKTRIEMRQIGVRDEAKLLADYGDCGKPVCCNTHLVSMPPVSMKMAKLQKATLDPTKISGRCGRLKCCLRYEFETYEDIQKQLPRIGAEIVTANGRARVINQQIIAEQLLVEMEDHRRMVIDASEVLSVIKNGSGRRSSHSDARRDSGNDNLANRESDAGKQRKPDSRSEHKESKGQRERKSGLADSDESKQDANQNRQGETSSKPTKKNRRRRRGKRKKEE